MKKFKVNDLVYPATKADAQAIGCTWWEETTTETPFRVLVVVYDCETYHHKVKESGLIVRKDSDHAVNYPYVWDFNRWRKNE